VDSPFKPYLAYSASAGSGKTFALSVRYISLLFLGEDPSTILAATFTNKAASEMKQRVVNSLIHLEENPIFLNAISEQTGIEVTQLLQRQPEVLERFLSSSNFIVTLDSFFTSVLRSASLYIDLEPDFVTKELDNKHKEQLFLEEVEANSLLFALVKLAMNIEDRRFLKIFDLLQNFYKIDPLLPKTHYPMPNITQLEEEIERKRAMLYQQVVASGASKSAIKNFESMEIKQLFKKSVFEKATLFDHRNYKKYLQQFPQIDQLFLELKALLAEWARAKEAVVLHNLFAIYDYYKNANIAMVKQFGVLSFDDLSYFTYRLLHESIDKEFLYFKIDSRFRHILLDEFQDTSTLQFLLLKPLIDEIFAGVGQQEFKSFFYVGDTKQSLYRFRGGVEELFDKVANRYGIEILQMDTNYRSAKHVVEQVNRWFGSTMEGFYPAKCREDASEGYVEVVISEDLVAKAVAKIQWLVQQGVLLSDIALLVSTNKDGATLQEACYAVGIATRLKTSSSLKHTPKIASLVAMVRYLFEGLELDAMALLQQIGGSIEQIDRSWFSPFMEPIEVIHYLIGMFGYFDEDPNLLKLLEFASEFRDIATFLEEFELSSIEVASSAKEGVMIMTIHGSKGLEFEHLIVLDRLKGIAPDRSTLLYDYDESLKIREVIYKISGRENFDEEYRTLLERQRVLRHKDQMNLLYVALTRAVESMIVIRKPKASIFDPLGMEPMVLGRLSPKDMPSCKEPPSTPQRAISLTHYGVQEIVTIDEEEERDYEAILFGLALHYTLEMMQDFDEESLQIALTSTQNRYGVELTDLQLADIQRRIFRLLQDEQFMRLFDGAEVIKEQSLSFEEEFKQIDLLLLYEDRVVVLDYKSSQKYHLKHKRQVGYYVKAIETIMNRPTEGVILYLLEDEVVFEAI
jgi:exodeoxyribonuclease V beta subunit